VIGCCATGRVLRAEEQRCGGASHVGTWLLLLLSLNDHQHYDEHHQTDDDDPIPRRQEECGKGHHMFLRTDRDASGQDP
jgi:hypothetical protein